MTYVSDTTSGFSPEKANEKASDEGGDITFHNANLFDLDEDLYGNIFDEATGRRIDNSTDTGLGALAVREIGRKNRDQEDILGDLPKSKADQLADEWMRARGQDWQ